MRLSRFAWKRSMASGRSSETCEALDGYRQKLGDMHPYTLISVNCLGALLHSQGKLAEAEPLYREALDGSRQKFGDMHPETLISVSNLGMLLKAQGKLDEAEPLHREALDGFRQKLGDMHPYTLISVNCLGALLHSQGKLRDPAFRQQLGSAAARPGQAR
eukprot:TRINITY_DN13305_c0_g1_i9.p1 TRINITY_DN13305_c0_g1~~TRINITY_DN13305_c0_g1_i9.p1  ORF type:complete len:160 (+),score=37.54 TRINITY_DN13305_c0_g1_i9:137-616(+)